MRNFQSSTKAASIFSLPQVPILDWAGTWLDLSGFQRPVTRSVYAVVLKKGDPNPVEPQSDDEKVAKPEDKAKDADKDKDKSKDKDKGKGKDLDKKEEKKDDKKEEPVTVTHRL